MFSNIFTQEKGKKEEINTFPFNFLRSTLKIHSLNFTRSARCLQKGISQDSSATWLILLKVKSYFLKNFSSLDFFFFLTPWFSKITLPSSKPTTQSLHPQKEQTNKQRKKYNFRVISFITTMRLCFNILRARAFIWAVQSLYRTNHLCLFTLSSSFRLYFNHSLSNS